MTETSYTAWDDKLYQWPPPDGWYQAGDGKWWPAGYGPGPAAPAGEPVGLDQGAAHVGTEASEPVAGALDSAGDAVSDVAENSADALGGARDALGGVADEAGGSLGGLGRAGTALGGVTDGAGDALSGAADRAGGALGGVTDGAGDALSGAADRAGGALGGVTDGAGDAFGGAGDALGGVTDGAGDAFSGATDRAGDAFSGVTDGVGDRAGDALGRVADDAGRGVGGALDGAADAVPGSIGDVVDDASAGIGDAAEGITGAASAFDASPATSAGSDIGFSERFGQAPAGASDAASQLAETMGTSSDGLDASTRDLAAQHDLSFDPSGGGAGELDPPEVGGVEVDESLWAAPPGQAPAADVPSGIDGFSSDPDLSPPSFDAVSPSDLPPPASSELSSDPLAASFDPAVVPPPADGVEAPASGSYDPTTPLPGDGLATAGFEEVAPPPGDIASSPLSVDPSLDETLQGSAGQLDAVADGFQAPQGDFGTTPSAMPAPGGDLTLPAAGLDAPTAAFEAQAPGFDAQAPGFDAQAPGFDGQAAGMQAPVAGFDAGAAPAPGPDGVLQQPFGQPGAPAGFQQPPPGSDPTAAWNQPSVGGAPAGPPLQGGPVDVSTPKGSRSRWLLIALGVLALLAICAAIYYLLTRTDDSTPEATGPGSLAEPHDRSNGVLVFYPSGDDRQEWVITVLEPVSDASAEVDETPAAGQVFATTRIRVLNQAGSDNASLDGLRFNAVTSSGEVIDGVDNRCSVGGDLDYAAQLAESQQIEGVVCWELPADDLDGLLLGIESTEIAGRVHVTLDP